MKTEVGIALLGSGWVTTNRHLPAIQSVPNARLTGIVDRKLEDAERLAGISATRGLPTATTLGELPSLKDTHAVAIGTVPMVHFEQCRDALKLGLHVIVEKPLTMAPEQAHELKVLAEEKGVTLAVVHNFQFSRCFLKLKRLIDTGGLGEILGVNATQLSNENRRLPDWYEDLPWGLFYDESPHFFYLLRSLYPDLKLANAVVWPSTRGRKTPALVSANYLAQGAPPITLNMNFEAPLSEWHLVVHGSKATAVADIFRDILVSIPSDGSHSPSEILRTSAQGIASHLWGVFSSGLRFVGSSLDYGNREVFARFCAAIESNTLPMQISVDDGATVVRFQHEIMNQAQIIARD